MQAEATLDYTSRCQEPLSEREHESASLMCSISQVGPHIYTKDLVTNLPNPIPQVT